VDGPRREDGALVGRQGLDYFTRSLAWANDAGNQGPGGEVALRDNEGLDLGVGMGDEQAKKGQRTEGLGS
jgi:hypothetical protein